MHLLTLRHIAFHPPTTPFRRQTLSTFSGDFRAYKAQIAAQYNGARPRLPRAPLRRSLARAHAQSPARSRSRSRAPAHTRTHHPHSRALPFLPSAAPQASS
jgi:hypothetical protein